MSGFTDDFFGGSAEDFLIRELTDPDSPEFEGRDHSPFNQQARSIALMAMTGTKPQGREEARALRHYLEELLGRNLTEEGRAWLAGIQRDGEPEAGDLTEQEILQAVDRHYPGGWDAFIQDGEPS